MDYFNKKNSNYGGNSSKKDHSKSSHQSYTIPNFNSHKGRQYPQYSSQQIKDYGPYPFAVNIEKVAKSNNAFRTALWTGEFMQLTLMSLLPGENIGLEIHNDLDQFIRIEEGQGILMMGDSKDIPNFQQTVFDDYAFIIPAGKWHNLINIGSKPLKLYSIYAPPQHPFGTVHETKTIADEAEQQYLKKA